MCFAKICIASCVLFAGLLFPSISLAQKSKLACIPYLERLERYFSLHEMRAHHIVNNEIDPGPAKGGSKKIDFGGVSFEWIVTPKEKYAFDISIKINGHQISLKDQKPINLADQDRHIEPKLLSKWDQVRLYDLGGDRKVVAVTLLPDMCTGLMCSVGAQLYFDLKTKQTSFFGSYRTDGEAKLYSFGEDGGAAFVVAANFSGDPHGNSESVVTYELYRLDLNGSFVHAGDTRGAKYYIRHVRQPEKSRGWDSVEERWIERLRLDQ